MTIEKEHFEAWLFSQPDDRTFNYDYCFNCVIACFLKECTEVRRPNVGSTYWYNRDDYSITNPIPDWLQNLLRVDLNNLIVANLKAIWLKHNPEVETSNAGNVQPITKYDQTRI